VDTSCVSCPKQESKSKRQEPYIQSAKSLSAVKRINQLHISPVCVCVCVGGGRERKVLSSVDVYL
jgi:hypothetical protein